MKQEQQKLDSLRKMYEFHFKQVPQPVKILERLEEQIIFLQELLESNPVAGAVSSRDIKNSRQAGAAPPTVNFSVSDSSSAHLPDKDVVDLWLSYVENPLLLNARLPLSQYQQDQAIRILRKIRNTPENRINKKLCLELVSNNFPQDPFLYYLANPALLMDRLPLSGSEQKTYLQKLEIMDDLAKPDNCRKVNLKTLLQFNAKPNLRFYFENPLLLVSMLPLPPTEQKAFSAALDEIISYPNLPGLRICQSLIFFSGEGIFRQRQWFETQRTQGATVDNPFLTDDQRVLSKAPDWLDRIEKLETDLKQLPGYAGSDQEEYILNLRKLFQEYRLLVVASPDCVAFRATVGFTDEECLEMVQMLFDVFRGDFEDAKNDIPEWLKYKDNEPAVEEYLKKLFTQVNIALQILLASKGRVTVSHARKLVAVWKCTVRPDLKDYFRKKGAGLTPVASFLSEESKTAQPTADSAPLPKEEKKPESKGQLQTIAATDPVYPVCEWLHDWGGWIPYSVGNSELIFEALQTQRESLNLELKINEEEYKITFVKEGLQQRNLKNGKLRPVRIHYQWNWQGPPIWQTVAPTIRSGLLSVAMRASDEILGVVKGFHHGCPDYVILDIKVNYNLERWLKYWSLRESYRARLGARFEERGLWHGTDAGNVASICHQGFRDDFVKNYYFGKGNYFARDPWCSLLPEYAKPASDKSQTLIYAYVAVGDVCVGTKEMRQPPLKSNSSDSKDLSRYENTINKLILPDICVTYDDSQVFPALVIRVIKDPQAAKIQRQTQSYPPLQDSKTVGFSFPDLPNLGDNLPVTAASPPPLPARHPVISAPGSSSMFAVSSSPASSSGTLTSSSSSSSSSAITTGGSPALFGSSTSSTSTGGTPSASVPGSASPGATT